MTKLPTIIHGDLDVEQDIRDADGNIIWDGEAGELNVDVDADADTSTLDDVEKLVLPVKQEGDSSEVGELAVTSDGDLLIGKPE